MPSRVAVSTLNASTIDILNTIRANASAEYMANVPEVTQATDIPKVGEVLYGYPALANTFLNALMNRIALVRVKSATFNNAYRELKKGYLEYGETVEEVFVNIAKARAFSAEKAEKYELKRTLPDVRSAFHAINWRVQYPVTIENDELRTAFMSMEGVQDMIAKIVDSLYTAVELDEYLVMKYMLIKAITKGDLHAEAVDTTTISDLGIAFRGASSLLQFMSTKYNRAGVQNTTPLDRQYIFMDAKMNAKYSVDVLAAAFNLDRATFIGKQMLVDDWSTFDNDRFSQLVAETDALEPVTAAELAAMQKVRGVLIDSEWFQIYDNLIQFTETYVGSGLYWNYFLTTFKTFSSSPFANAVVFVEDASAETLPTEYTVEVVSNEISETGRVLVLQPQIDSEVYSGGAWEFVYDGAKAVSDGIGIQKYGAVIIPKDKASTAFNIGLRVGGTIYRPAIDDSSSEADPKPKVLTTIDPTSAVGTTYTFLPNIDNTLG